LGAAKPADKPSEIEEIIKGINKKEEGKDEAKKADDEYSDDPEFE